jgi:dihydropteroate synthase
MWNNTNTFYQESFKQIHLMGILNVTPDSFSDGGQYLSMEKALAHARMMKADGADIIDVGGESTRPGADPVPLQQELDRVIPVIEKLSKEIDVVLSIDTYKSQVADDALQAGAHIVNDISGLTFDADMAGVAAKHGAALILMHMKGTPKNMQINPEYHNVVAEVKQFLDDACHKARLAGVTRLFVDPGFGFGKRAKDNFTLLKNLETFQSLGCPIVVGTSRKSFLGNSVGAGPHERVEGTIVTNVIAAQKGATILRVHDVKTLNRAMDLTQQIMNA